jgi:hypothetical protein
MRLEVPGFCGEVLTEAARKALFALQQRCELYS